MVARTKETTNIRIATYIIRNGHQGNLERALRALKKMNIDIGVLEEKNIDDERYTKQCFDYEVLVTKAETAFQGGIALVYPQ
jgi:hypothetical protein